MWLHPVLHMAAGPFDAATEELLDGWVGARRTRNFARADELRDQLRGMNIEPEISRPAR